MKLISCYSYRKNSHYYILINDIFVKSLVFNFDIYNSKFHKLIDCGSIEIKSRSGATFIDSTIYHLYKLSKNKYHKKNGKIENLYFQYDFRESYRIEFANISLLTNFNGDCTFSLYNKY